MPFNDYFLTENLQLHLASITFRYKALAASAT